MPTFGLRSADTVEDRSGNWLSGTEVKLYPTRADALADTNLIATVVTIDGRWSYDVDLPELWVRVGTEDPYLVSAEQTAMPLATQITLQQLLDLFVERASSTGEAHLVSGSRVKYRREFNDPTLAEWDVVQGPGMVVSVAGGALNVTTGTTANAVTTLTAKQTFSAPFRAGFGFKISQKIANVEFYMELIAVNADGSLDESCVAAWRIAGSDSLTTSIARYEVRNGGAARLQSANTSTVATQTTDSVYELVLESDEVWFHSRTADNVGARFTSYNRQTVSPDPNREYRLRYRIVNAATPPASSTTMTASHVVCVDYTELQAEITGSGGSIAGAQAMPVYSVGGSVGVTSTSLAASASVAGVTPLKVLSAATTNATLIKAAAGRIYGWQLANTSASWRYVKLYNKATAPVPGTDVPTYTLALPPNSASELALPVPLSHATGIGFAITAGPADLDAVAVAANDVVGHFQYA